MIPAPKATMPRVLFVPFSGVAVAGSKPPHRWKRLFVWDNAGRNRLVASVAAGVAKDAGTALSKLGVRAADRRLPGRLRQRVVVLAETADHAHRLGRLLPGWVVRDAVPSVHHTEWGPDEPDPDDGPPPGWIATLVYVARFSIGCDVLVRATGGTGRLGWDSIRGRGKRAGTVPRLLIDVADQAGDREDKDTEIRRREYQVQGLEVLKAVVKPKNGAR